MAYLPYYLTPEEFEVYQEEQEKQIRSSNLVNEWSCNNIEEANRYDALLFTAWSSLLPGLIVMGPIGYIGYEHFNWVAPFCIFIVFSIVAYSWYLTVGLDNHYKYTLSHIGLVQKQNRAEPKWLNKAIQSVAWICSIGCLLAVAIAGPMVLVGSGALMLLAFGMTKRQPQSFVETTVAMRDDWLFAHYNKRRKVIQLFHKYDYCAYEDVAATIACRTQGRCGTYLFFDTIEELTNTLTLLSDSYKLECVEIDDHKHIFSIEGQSPERLLAIPARANTYSVADTYDLKSNNAPLPNWEYMYSGKWVTEQELREASNRSGSLTE